MLYLVVNPVVFPNSVVSTTLLELWALQAVCSSTRVVCEMLPAGS